MAKMKKIGKLYCQCHTVFSAEYGKTGSAIECRCIDQRTQEQFLVDDITLSQTRAQKIKLR